MMVSLVQCSAVIRIFNCQGVTIPKNHLCSLSKNLICLFKILLVCWHYFESAFIFLLALTYIFLLLQCHGDIELNPGPQKVKTKSLFVCHWNLNSLSAHNFSKLTQLKAYISVYKHDFICLSKTYLDSTIPHSLLEIDGYNLVRADHPNNIKRGGVCIHYKESLPVGVISLPYFKEALLLEITDNNTKIAMHGMHPPPAWRGGLRGLKILEKSLLEGVRNFHFGGGEGG